MTELTDRMRTCAARIAAITDRERNDASINDAVDLLIEASNLLEAAPEPLGAPMPLLEPLRQPNLFGTDMTPPPTPTTIGKQRSPHACPKCDSRAAKKVRRDGRQLVLACPVCATEWPWRPQAEWR